MRIVLIEWVDSAGLHGWQSIADANEFDMAETVISTVGWLYKESKKSITLVMSHGIEHNVYSVLQIPKAIIKSTKFLEVE